MKVVISQVKFCVVFMKGMIKGQIIPGTRANSVPRSKVDSGNFQEYFEKENVPLILR